MQTQTWLCGVVVGCGMVMAVPPLAPMSGPPTGEELVEPEVRQAVEESRSLLGNTIGEASPTRVLPYEELSEEMKARGSVLRMRDGDTERIREFAEKRAAEIHAADIEKTVNAFHKSASEADFDGYFALMHEDGVFLGTDATERWTKGEFMDYARPIMVEQGKGWTYAPRDRQVSVSGDVAWFDELIENEKYGTLRGQGVLLRDHGKWQIAQYSYSFTVPNDKAKAVVGLILAPEADDAGEGP